jgi:hypothetical protein
MEQLTQELVRSAVARRDGDKVYNVRNGPRREPRNQGADKPASACESQAIVYLEIKHE